MKKLFALLIFLVCSFNSFSQENILWASRVVKYSSQLTATDCSSKQILGKPNVLHNGAESLNSWVPNRDKQPSITVSFDFAIQVQQIAIAEASNPGYLRNVYAIDTKGNEHLLIAFRPSKIPIKSRLLNIFLDQTPYKVKSIKLDYKKPPSGRYIAVDAIAISNSKRPIAVKINDHSLLAANI